GFHLQPGGRLGGNGTLRSDLVNEGTVAPGESIGILTIDGTYTHAQNGTLEVETRADGDTDLLRVAGTATLLGGTVQVLPDDHVRNYRGKTVSYDILVAEGGIDGQFAESTTPFLFLRTGLSYKDEPAGGNTAVLELTGLSFSELAISPNEKSVAQMLDALADRDLTSPLVTAAYSYPVGSESAYRDGLISLSGEIYTTFPVASVATIDRFAQAVVRG